MGVGAVKLDGHDRAQDDPHHAEPWGSGVRLLPDDEPTDELLEGIVRHGVPSVGLGESGPGNQDLDQGARPDDPWHVALPSVFGACVRIPLVARLFGL